jgi:integrase
MNSQRYYTSLVEQKTGTIIPYVFHNEGQPIGDFRDSWSKACKAAGVAGKLVHDLRRTAVRNMERAGASRSVAMRISGHKTESIYKRYAVTNEKDLAEGIKRIERLHFGGD